MLTLRRIAALMLIAGFAVSVSGATSSLAEPSVLPREAPAIPQVSPPRVTVVVAPEHEVRRVISRGSTVAGVGLGVYPGARDEAAFIEEIGAQAPRGAAAAVASSGGRPGRLLETLRAGGIEVRSFLGAGAPAAGANALLRAFPVGPPAREVGDARLLVGSVERLDDVTALNNPSFLIGVDGAAPALVVWLPCGRGCDAYGDGGGVLVGGIARRSGVVTPYDVAASILDVLGVEDAAMGGGVLQIRARPEELATIDALRARMLRDASFGGGLTKAALALALAAAAIAWLAWRRRAIALAEAAVRAGSAVPLGYIAGLFVPHQNGLVRSIAVVVAMAVVAAAPARGGLRRTIGGIMLATAALLALLVVLAALRPDAEPALSLWGDPLVSWRFFGLRNHLAAFLALAWIAGALLLALPTFVAVVGSVAVLALVGAPWLGANFLGVLTLGWGLAVACLVRIDGAVRARRLVLAGIAAAVATVAALGAAAAANVSHGGRAVGSIADGGVSAAWGIFRNRAALNLAEITSLGAIGWIAAAVLTVALVALLLWAVRWEGVERDLRALVAGGSVAGIGAFVLEDSGFLMAGDIVLFPALGWAIWRLSGVDGSNGGRAVTSAASAPPARSGEPPAGA